MIFYCHLPMIYLNLSFFPFYLLAIFLKHEVMNEAKRLQVRNPFMFNLYSKDCWRGSNLPPRDSFHAALTHEGSHMFFLIVSA